MGSMEVALPQRLTKSKLTVKAHVSVPDMDNSPVRVFLSEEAFVSMLYLERRRAERARKRFVLMLVDVKNTLAGLQKERHIHALTASFQEATRETDILGWYLENNLMGMLGTELGEASNKIIEERLLAKVRGVFEKAIGKEKSRSLSVSFHFFPEECNSENGDHTGNIALYPELKQKEDSQRLALSVKRMIDVVGSIFALLLFSPLFALVALAIKLTSQGPVLYKQERLGQFGKPFKLVKFRSMRTNCNSKIHQEYVSQFIATKADASSDGEKKTVYKIQKDPRVTPIGHFIRKASLDELPQFWNVLCGEMSLVGPRPPIAYEFCAYEVWHRRRVLEIRPGVTGLWQVKGRSRTRFDDMVRLDLKYARAWSIWLDMKIILQTPGAVLWGDGAH
jgi:lipopolysaccharide/colanic/teichoic acid biosynthesis glycosyltransferase